MVAEKNRVICFDTEHERTIWKKSMNYTYVDHLPLGSIYRDIEINEIIKTYIGNHNRVSFFVKLTIDEKTFLINEPNSDEWNSKFKGLGSYIAKIQKRSKVMAHFLII